MIRLDGTDAEFNLRILYSRGHTNAMRIVSAVINENPTVDFRAYIKLVDLLSNIYERGNLNARGNMDLVSSATGTR